MGKKVYDKKCFSFIDENGNIKNGKEGDIYFNTEYTFKLKFPFVIKENVIYKLINNKWCEQ